MNFRESYRKNAGKFISEHEGRFSPDVIANIVEKAQEAIWSQIIMSVEEHTQERISTGNFPQSEAQSLNEALEHAVKVWITENTGEQL